MTNREPPHSDTFHNKDTCTCALTPDRRTVDDQQILHNHKELTDSDHQTNFKQTPPQMDGYPLRSSHHALTEPPPTRGNKEKRKRKITNRNTTTKNHKHSYVPPLPNASKRKIQSPAHANTNQSKTTPLSKMPEEQHHPMQLEPDLPHGGTQLPQDLFSLSQGNKVHIHMYPPPDPKKSESDKSDITIHYNEMPDFSDKENTLRPMTVRMRCPYFQLPFAEETRAQDIWALKSDYVTGILLAQILPTCRGTTCTKSVLPTITRNLSH
jgi:hypothetical protein